MEIDFREIFHALSDTLDLVGVDDVYHGKRVAYMALECARAYGFDEDALNRIYHAGLIHDCGVSSTTVHRYLTTDLNWQASRDHCIAGADLLRRNNFVPELAPLIYYHHTRWLDLQDVDLPLEDKLLSNCIYLVDRADALMIQRKNVDVLTVYHEIRQILKNYRGKLFAPRLVDVFLDISRSEFFWLGLLPRHIDYFVREMSEREQTKKISRADFLNIAKVFASVVDAKSPFTAEHSFGVSYLAKFVGERAGMAEEICREIQIAGLLHDIGKLNIPDEILEKPGPLTIGEKSIMVRHSFETYQVLRRIKGLGSITRWASFHHEKLNGSGYPFGLNAEEIPEEARIVSVADIFQALMQNRPYRQGLKGGEITTILQKYAASGCIDSGYVDLVHDNLDECLQLASCHAV